MKPVCVGCMLFFKPRKNGVVIEEGRPLNDEGDWGPYKLWVGDLLVCHGCGAMIVTGFGHGPIAEHYQPDYAEKRERNPPIGRVDDC